MRLRLLALLTAALAVLLLAGCGGSRTVTTPVIPASACPANQAQMGCNTPHALLLAPRLSTPTGPLFPDVSQWQGAVGWGSVAAWQHSHGWRPAAIFKLGEYSLDPQATRNASETARLGFWRAGYWFLRNTGCAHEAGLIVWAAHRFGLKVVVLDAEVPEARGYSACLAPPLKAAGLTVVEYTSPGSNPDSANPGLPMWTAAFGPSHTPCVWTCTVGQPGQQSILAWQFTDGQWGSVTTIPGIGRDDVSVDYGITRLPVVPKPPLVLPVCYTHRLPAGQCAQVKAKVAGQQRAAASSARALAATNRVLARNACRTPYRRGVCVRKGHDARVFSQRVNYFTAAARKLEAAS